MISYKIDFLSVQSIAEKCQELIEARSHIRSKIEGKSGKERTVEEVEDIEDEEGFKIKKTPSSSSRSRQKQEEEDKKVDELCRSVSDSHLLSHKSSHRSKSAGGTRVLSATKQVLDLEGNGAIRAIPIREQGCNIDIQSSLC